MAGQIMAWNGILYLSMKYDDFSAGRAQEEMLRRGNLHRAVVASTDGAARRDEVHRIEGVSAIVALVAARLRVAAMRAGAFDKAVGKKTAVGRAIGRLHCVFEDIPFSVQS